MENSRHDYIGNSIDGEEPFSVGSNVLDAVSKSVFGCNKIQLRYVSAYFCVSLATTRALKQHIVRIMDSERTVFLDLLCFTEPSIIIYCLDSRVGK